MTSEQKNYQEVHTFLQDQGVYRDPMSSFEAWVEYQHSEKSPQGRATVYIKKDGCVEIVGENFDSVHTGFCTKYQTFNYDRGNRKLTIIGKGDTDKLYGDYTVSISLIDKK